ncbi:MAG: hypothetical protein HFF11_05125 [Angelakisella sp.]|jgi:hypothetical protein|nr:hypothetical protein [Angelakisella sp.]
MTNTEGFLRSLFGVTRFSIVPLALAIDIEIRLIFSDHIPMDDIQVTKHIYPLVAEQMNASRTTASRRIERLTHQCWDALMEKDMLEDCIGCKPFCPPSPASLLRYLAVYLHTGKPYELFIMENPKFVFNPSEHTEEFLSTNKPYLRVLFVRDKPLPVLEMCASGALSHLVCPSCYAAMEKRKQNFCANCGQRLDWSQL